MNFLIDYNLKGKSLILWDVLAAEGWLELIQVKFLQFNSIGAGNHYVRSISG